MSEMVPSSGSSSPFTPKRSKVKRKDNRELNSVSRALTFDDSNSHSPFKINQEFLPLSQQASLSCEYLPLSQQVSLPCEYLPLNQQVSLPCEYNNKSEQTTPVKTQQSSVEKNNKILFSPTIKNCPNRFNIDKQEINTVMSSPNKRNGSIRATPSKKIKSSIMENCKPITFYFKPTQKRQDLVVQNSNFQSTNHKSNEENMNPKIKKENNKSTQKTPVKSTLANENIIKHVNVGEQVTPKKSINMNNNFLKSPIIDYIENRVNISGGDTYSRFIKSIVIKAEMICLGKSNIVTTIENCTNDELKIYGRLISRKHGWIRADEPDGLNKYKELNLCDNFDNVLQSLASKQLINTGR